jgi:pyruvate/2-oxoglutarate/acetoin dehydrogenase E1 component
MPEKSYTEAIREALDIEMERDPTVIIIGEDVAGGAGTQGDDVEAIGGIWGTTVGLTRKYGRSRVIDTPITESAIIGTAAGAAMTGLRPVAELMFVDFVGVCFDQIYNQAAKFKYMFGGKATTPLVIRTAVGAGLSAAAQHSQTMFSTFTSVPGLKVVMPSNPYDAKGLLIQAIRDDDPVIFCEHKLLYGMTGEVPDGEYTIPFAEANWLKDGEDLTIIAFSAMVPKALEAAEKLEAEGINCTVIDPRTTSPLDEESILASAEETGRVVIVDESTPRCSIASDISSIIAEKAFKSLKAPIRKVTTSHTPVPFSPALEQAYLPQVDDILSACREVLGSN